MAVVVPLAYRVRTRRVDNAVPHRGHAADNGGPDQCQYERSQFAIEHTHHPLVAREQTRHAACCRRIHRKQLTRHINHAPQTSRARHVDTVIIPRAEIQRGKAAAVSYTHLTLPTIYSV